MTLIKTDGSHFPTSPTLFNDLFTREMWNFGLENNSRTGTTIPAVNIKETDDHFEVDMAAPGMEKDDFRIELDGTQLTIFSEKEHEEEHREGDRFSRKEFSYQSFVRTFELPKEVVDDDRIEARYAAGVLKLLIPKKEAATHKPKRMINIR